MAKAAKAAAPKVAAPEVEEGSKITFLGYGPDVPEDEKYLEQNTVYDVAGIDEDGNPVVHVVNPDFDPEQEESEENYSHATVPLLANEYVLYEEEVKPAKPAKAVIPPTKEKAKAPVSTTSKPTSKAKVPVAKAPIAKKQEQEEKEEKVDPLEEVLEQEDTEVAALVEGSDIAELVQELSQRSLTSEWQLAGALYHLYRDKQYREIGEQYAQDGGFDLFVEDLLKIGARKARYLIQTYIRFNKVGMTGEHFVSLGWVRSSKIATYLTEGNAEEIYSLATSTGTVKELEDSIKTSYNKPTEGRGGNRSATRTLKIKLHLDTANAVEAILLAVQEENKLTSLNDALSHIVLEYGTTHGIGEVESVEQERPAPKPVAKLQTAGNKPPVAVKKKAA